MQLFFSPTSPYVRKVRVVLHERGLNDAIEEIRCDPHSDPVELHRVNPLGKVPTLVRDDGSSLYDSRVICAWLDSLGQGSGLIPGSGEGRWLVLRGEALADGVLDQAVANVMELRRPEGERSSAAMSRVREKIAAAVPVMAREFGSLPPEPTLAHVAFAVALGYLDFRLADYDWRQGHDALGQWYSDFSRRPSMVATAPPSA